MALRFRVWGFLGAFGLLKLILGLEDFEAQGVVEERRV